MSFSSSFQILKHKEFRWFVLARFFLTLAIQLQMSTINLQIYYEYSKEEIVLGMIGLTEALPFIATSFFSGHLADIINRRKILLLGCTALLIGSLFLFSFSNSLFSWIHNFGMYPLFAVVFVFGIIRSFLAVSAHPFMSQLIPRDLYTQSATWNTTAWHIGSVLGPVIAGLMYGYHQSFHANWCYGTTCVLFVCAIICFGLIKSKPIPVKTKKETFIQSMSVGVKFVFKNKLVLSALSLDLFAVLFSIYVKAVVLYHSSLQSK